MTFLHAHCTRYGWLCWSLFSSILLVSNSIHSIQIVLSKELMNSNERWAEFSNRIPMFNHMEYTYTRIDFCFHLYFFLCFVTCECVIFAIFSLFHAYCCFVFFNIVYKNKKKKYLENSILFALNNLKDDFFTFFFLPNVILLTFCHHC